MLNRLARLAAFALVLSACSSTPAPDGAPAPLRVLATSSLDPALSQQAAGDYRAVRLFVSEVVLVHGGAPRTLASYEEPLELELLGLRDLQAELADAALPSGTYQGAQLRLVLADAELVVEGEDGESVTHDLETPSAEQSGYKVQLGDLEVDPQGAILLLEFDPECSIVETGNGRYQLVPVVRVSQLSP